MFSISIVHQGISFLPANVSYQHHYLCAARMYTGISAYAGICKEFREGHEECSLSYVPLASKNSHIIQRIVPASLHTRLWLPVCPTTEQQNRCIKSFCCCNESSIKSWRYSQCDTEIIQGWNQNEMGSAQNINPTSYELFRLILMIAIVLAAFTIISASCNLLQLAWLQAWVPGCRIQLL